jgi:crotonobetainyl-CoA:carnitine CoA-transferase CaiB-like acyl-CoA transferase
MHILSDPRFDTPANRQAESAALVELLTALFKTRTRAEWAALLNASECIWAPIQSPAEVPNDPQVVANEYVLSYEHPSHGQFRVASSPVQFNSQAPEVRRAASELGADTEQVLLELGYTWEEIAGLKEANAIC